VESLGGGMEDVWGAYLQKLSIYEQTWVHRKAGDRARMFESAKKYVADKTLIQDLSTGERTARLDDKKVLSVGFDAMGMDIFDVYAPTVVPVRVYAMMLPGVTGRFDKADPQDMFTTKLYEGFMRLQESTFRTIHQIYMGVTCVFAQDLDMLEYIMNFNFLTEQGCNYYAFLAREEGL
jgi:hypothetical protein